MNNQELWLHIDVNSYFASILQQENPALRGKALGVVKDQGRTCLIATSREAKKMGISTGTLLKDAQEKCPSLIVLPAAFQLYLSATHTLESVLGSFSPDVEMFSLDEAFLYYTPICRQYVTPQDCALRIQHALKKNLGEWVTCSVGISHTKFLAKLAGEKASTDEIQTITEETKDGFLSQVQFKDVCGVGHRLERKLALLGVYNPYAIRFIPKEQLVGVFGAFWASELKKIAYGEETHLLSHRTQNEHMKSVSRSITCMGAPWKTERGIQSILYNLTTDVCHKARALGLAGRHFSVSLKGRTEYWSTHQIFTTPLSHSRTTAQIIWNTILYHWEKRFPVIRCHVSLNLLSPHLFLQESLLPEWQRSEKIEQAVMNMNAKYGPYTLRPATLLRRSEILKPEVNGFFGDRPFYSMQSPVIQIVK